MERQKEMPRLVFEVRSEERKRWVETKIKEERGEGKTGGCPPFIDQKA